ncbi:NADH dehydrogenase [ubiquinone] 1 alpha subcomplex subunit 8 [Lepeophtheirus salmonis]|uniref:NADH dehydrogenase [ubiquinone] 1 alpha subcomplex subunit 8 n=1 Tax=Lepeophtheirus salmonis TaxID=72036 RepID=C1BSJ0_LEPSM|nr:NADH dehydrogenase [ubiquinone] 1 alpha subcomplex subunit 8-like [Lepeophtheirus salmonis]ACO11993.1 NADH dehydrogenase 1 alpha subcomplex subunit 8 [Lepeophtheirus salmonis]ADD24242.1 NADH dehydrogenase 1 alpha subcomplex subunit 8 [Lepeophtheirus salmonis]ADD37883.1 NADH dehydrogenase 1 alpha subcomplex subunit 8 [Lepeophtheirus salmonis]
MVLTKDTFLPSTEELTIQEVPLGTPYLRAGAFHLGKTCEAVNNEFMLCRQETNDPRACLQEGKNVTNCSHNFFQKVKDTCASEFTTYAMCLEKSSNNFSFDQCRKTQESFDSCMERNNKMIRPYFGYFSLTRVHDSNRPKPVEERPKWMDDPKGVKSEDVPTDLPLETKRRHHSFSK